ncbi:Luc7-like protein [Durusdinium trenchii]|uniref:Luc7-like protein n=1 Tax=Durusdinium trenchii TaxID=1381693 RepID=A0ABP0Q955_9DINO
MGNLQMTLCNKVLSCDYSGVSETLCSMGRSVRGEDMQLALRVVFAPMEGKNSLKMGDEFLISNIKKVPGWEPLSWRQERVAQQHATGKSAVWPSLSESRFARPMRHWSVEAYGSDGKGGVRSLRGLLQVAHLRKDRELEQVKAAVHEISAVADYARRFNHHVAQLDGFDGEVPTIRVATSMACFVLDGIAPDVVDAGDTAVLTLFDEKEVTKFVFEGSEDFVELPHSFFHFVLWNSGGQDLVADLQGAQHEDEFILVDPVLLKTGDLDLSQLLEMATSSEVPSRNKKRFDQWHPRCAQLCRSFDPQRRSGHARRACGVPLPNCGVGGG